MDEQTNNANLGKIADLSTKSIIDRNLRQRKKKPGGYRYDSQVTPVNIDWLTFRKLKIQFC